MNKKNASEKVYKIIEGKILSGEWKPGMKIYSENKLSQDLGVSRVSVREAIEKLVAFNVLTKRQGEGTFVNDLNPSIYLNGLMPMILLDRDNIIDILEFRLIIEVDSARMCTKRCSNENIIELQDSYDRMLRYKDQPDIFFKEDFRFHSLIARGTNNSLIIKVNSILTDLLMFHQKKLHTFLGSQGGLKDHIKILNAIKERDSELAALFMKRHINRTLEDVRKFEKEII